MAKKSATYLDYEVVVEDNGAITVRKSLCLHQIS